MLGEDAEELELKDAEPDRSPRHSSKICTQHLSEVCVNNLSLAQASAPTCFRITTIILKIIMHTCLNNYSSFTLRTIKK